MRLFLMDNDGDGVGVNLAVRAQDAGHSVRYWTPSKSGPYGKGILDRTSDWEPQMDWAELIVLTGNAKYGGPLAEYFGMGYPIFGSNARSAELELDREVGQKVLKDHGIRTLPYRTVDSLDSAIQLVADTSAAYAIKPWGGESDKAMTCVAKDADEAIFMLTKWKEQGLKGQLMLQEKVEGVEIGISGFFGPGGWNKAIEESFEHKKFLNDDLGCNTGEMGTVIRHVSTSKLFDKLLKPLTDYLHECNYVGDCSVNCMIDESGVPWPMEFTMRLGWPDFNIRQALIKSDPVEWMADLVHGDDTLDVSTDVAVGVVLTHGDFPTSHDPGGTWEGYPIKGAGNEGVHLQQVMRGLVQTATGRESELLTAGNYLMVCTGTGKTIRQAKDNAYDVAWGISLPSNLMFRTDIGDRLKRDLPKLHQHGYAEGMEF
jgi:phosphoribosylamine---glycine ligase